MVSGFQSQFYRWCPEIIVFCACNHFVVGNLPFFWNESCTLVEYDSILTNWAITGLHAVSASKQRPCGVIINSPKNNKLLTWTWTVHSQNYNESNKIELEVETDRGVGAIWEFSHVLLAFSHHKQSYDDFVSLYVTLSHLFIQTAGGRTQRHPAWNTERDWEGLHRYW